MKRKAFKKIQKIPVFVYCEGVTEIQLFRFLKRHFDKSVYDIRPPKDLKGVSDLADIQKTHKDITTKLKQDYGSRIAYLKLFIIDGDLVDSPQIKRFLSEQGCLVEQFSANTEQLLLSLVGKPVRLDVPLGDYRAKCKRKFEEHFGCTADKLDEKTFKVIFPNSTVVGTNVPIIKSILDPD